MKIAINGLGRIGKTFLRGLLTNEQSRDKIDVIAINLGPAAPKNLALFFKYDSILGTFHGNVSFDENASLLKIDFLNKNHEIKIFHEADPAKLPWKSLDIDWVVEASGKFTTKKLASLHLEAGAKKILITAPSTDEDITVIPGVNDSSYVKEKHNIVSLGSCTTNCFAPIIKVLKEKFELTQGLMTTTHAYTNNQALLDSKHNDPRRGRSAATNIIPTTTGADKVITKIYPDLLGKIQGIAMRVPVPIMSIVDFTFNTKKKISTELINDAFEQASKNELKNILQYCKEPLVSSDFIGSPYSCIIDSLMTRANGTIGKVFGWYDNESGYSSRLRDFLLHNS